MRTEDLSSIEIRDLSELDRAIDEASSLFQGMFTLWRGHANQQWPLRAEVFRPSSRGGKPYPEVSLVRTFMAHAESRSQGCPASDDLVGWLMLARRFGLPTRLLDWSQSPLVALYFAAQVDKDRPDADGYLWAIEPSYMNLQMMGNRRFLAPDEPPVTELVRIAFEPDSRLAQQKTSQLAGKAYAIGTRGFDPCALVQQGAFTIHSDGQDLADVDFRHPSTDNKSFWRRVFRVPRPAKSRVSKFLRELGVHESTLFPDLGTLAKELRSRTTR
jgi:FRG domain